MKVILFDIPHGSILEPIFFNIFMNDIFFLLGSDLHNFVDDNTVTAVAETIQDLINSLEVKTGNIIEWMKDNDMIANPNKFKAVVLSKTGHNSIAEKCFDIWGILKMASVKSVEPQNNFFSINHIIRCRSKFLPLRFSKFVLVLIL